MTQLWLESNKEEEEASPGQLDGAHVNLTERLPAPPPRRASRKGHPLIIFDHHVI